MSHATTASQASRSSARSAPSGRGYLLAYFTSIVIASPIYIGELKLRELFNSAILPRIEAGELLAFVMEDGPAHPKYGQVPNTRSQMVAYYEPGKSGGSVLGPKVAVAHRYLKPDGTLGASGRPDPKTILFEGRLYFGKEPKTRKAKGGRKPQ